MIKLYTIHCPKCLTWESMLKKNNIKYQEITDIKTIIDQTHLEEVPILEINGELITETSDFMKFIESTKEKNI